MLHHRGGNTITGRKFAPSQLVIAVIALGLAAVAAYQVAAELPAFRASRGAGVEGRFTATERSCSRGLCTWQGNFSSADGRTVLTGVSGRNVRGLHDRGDARPARELGGHVYALQGSQAWFRDLLGAVEFGFLSLVAFGVIIIRWGLRQRWGWSVRLLRASRRARHGHGPEERPSASHR